FLEQWNPARIAEFPLLDQVGPGFGTFRMAGAVDPVYESPAVLEGWQANGSQWQEKEDKKREDVFGQCLITGKHQQLLARLHPKIKGIANTQSAGAVIASYDGTAYESYGKE